MKLKIFLSKFALFFALTLSFFTVNNFSQAVKAEKTGSVAAYVRDIDEESGLVRKRIVETSSYKKIAFLKPSLDQIQEYEKQVFTLINQKRFEAGLEPLKWSEEVAKIARLHSENMMKFNFFSHRGVDGKMVDGRADSLGISKWRAIGENIAYNRGYKNPIETVVEKWMLSPSHRQNMLSERWKESALGIAVTDEGTFYFTHVFLKRK